MAQQSIISQGGTSINTASRIVYKDGNSYPFPDGVTGNNVVMINNHVMIDGYKLMPDGTWKDTQAMRKPKGFFKRLMDTLKGEK